MTSRSEALHHVDEESHEILVALRQAFRLCSDEGERIKDIAKEESAVTQELEKLDQKHSMSEREAQAVESQLERLDEELEQSEKEAEKMLKELDAARRLIEREMEEISEIVR